MGDIPQFPLNQEVSLSGVLGLTSSSGLLGNILSDVTGAIPFVGPLIKLITSFFHIGGGCGETCIASAKAEQVFEVAGDDVNRTVKAGMLDATDGQAILGVILSQGNQFLTKLIEQGDTRAQGGLTNMTQVLNSLASAMGKYGKASKALDIQAAQALFISPSNTGWYPQSVVSGNALATQILQTYQQSGLTASENTDVSGVLDTILSSLSTELQSAQNASSSTTSKILGGIAGLLGLAQAGSTDTGTKVLSGILGTIGLSQSTATGIASDISGVLDDLSTIIKDIQTDVFGKIIEPVLTSINNANLLQTTLEADLKNGLTGILQIPGQLANYLSSQQTATHQQTVLNNENRQSVASTILTPGIGGAISGSLDTLHESIKQLFGSPSVAPSEYMPLRLPEDAAQVALAHDMDVFRNAIDNTTLFGVHVFKYLVESVQYILGWLASEEKEIEYLEQQANLAFPIEPLSPERLVELLHRNLVSMSDAEVESKRSGLDQYRLTLLDTLAELILTPRETLDAWFRGIITDEAKTQEFQYQKYDKGREQILTELARFWPDAGTAANWFARSFLTPEQFRQTMKGNHWTDDEIDIAVKALFSPANAGEYTRYYARAQQAAKGFMAASYTSNPPADIDDIHRQNQQSTEQAKLDWLAHWKDIDPFTWVNGLYRGLINREFYQEAIESLNYPPETSNFLIDVSRPLIPFFYLTEMLASGVFTKEQAVSILNKYGFSQEDVDATIRFGDFKALGKASDQNNALAQLSVSNIKSMFDEKIINRSELIIALEEHGYNSEVAVLLADLYETEQNIKDNTDYATLQVNLVRIGTLTKLQALDNLAARGFTQAQIVKYELQIDNIKVQNAKMPSKADFDNFWKKGLITDDAYLAAITDLGYDSVYANLYLAAMKG